MAEKENMTAILGEILRRKGFRNPTVLSYRTEDIKIEVSFTFFDKQDFERESSEIFTLWDCLEVVMVNQ